jgi:hypothetical protein
MMRESILCCPVPGDWFANLALIPSWRPPTISPPVVPYLHHWLFFVLCNTHEFEPVTRVRVIFGQLNTRLAEAIDGIEKVKGLAQECWK